MADPLAIEINGQSSPDNRRHFERASGLRKFYVRARPRSSPKQH
jgi:hypothetical protein